MGLFTPRWKIDAQNLVCRMKQSRLVISDAQLMIAIKIYVNGHMKVIRDSQHLVNTTKKVNIFFGRYDTLIERAEALCKLDAIKPGLLTNDPAQQVRNCKANLPAAIDKMIDRCWLEAKTKADGLKTEKAKNNCFERLFDSFAEFDYRMFMSNREHIERLKIKAKK